MVLLQLHMQREAAHDTILKLGHLGCVQFRDMNPNTSAFQRLFTGDVRRCEESERRLRYFEEQLKRAKGHKHVTCLVDGYTSLPPFTLVASLEPRCHSTPVHGSSFSLYGVPVLLPHRTHSETLDSLEPKLESLESELRDLNSKWEQLLSQKNRYAYGFSLYPASSHALGSTRHVACRRPPRGSKRGRMHVSCHLERGVGDAPQRNASHHRLLSHSMKEHSEILTQPPSFFRGDDEGFSTSTAAAADEGTTFRVGGLRYLTGVINSDRAALFERLVYRATRGNMFMRTTPAKEQFEDPATGGLSCP